MTTEVIETERGLAVLFPNNLSLQPGPVNLTQVGVDTYVLSGSASSDIQKIEGYFDGPYEDNGLVAPEDVPPEPSPSF